MHIALLSICMSHDGDIRAAPPVVLRPYQESCLDACTAALESGCSRIGVSLPTGAGKTTVFISLLDRILPPEGSPDATRALIVVNSIELARQSAAQTSTLFPDWTVEIEQGSKHKASGKADVTIATYQTLLQAQRLAKFDPKGLKAVIIDEAHHAAAPSYRKLLSRFDTNIRNPDSDVEPPQLPHLIPIIGFSATFSRHDGLALGSVFERIVYHRDFLEMIKEQWLCDVRFTSVKASINLSDVTVSSASGDFNATSLAHVINTETVNNMVVQTWLDRAETRKSTLVFCVNLAHVRDLTQTFRQFGIDARYVHSGTPVAERRTLISSFKEGAFPVLVNCAILTEGADIPNIDCVVVARPTRSRNVFAQMIGRGMRQSPGTGKQDCRIIDFVDSTNRVAGVVSTPTLFGLDPTEIIDDDTTALLEERAARANIDIGVNSFSGGANVPMPTSVTYTDYENPFSLVDESSGAPHVAKLSGNAWVGCGGDVYVLECMGKGHIRIEPAKADEEQEAHYEAHFTPATLDRATAAAFKMSPFLRSRKVLTAANLSDAVRGCDTYAKTKVIVGSMALGLLRSAKWRKGPASEGQKVLVAKRYGKMSEGPDGSQNLVQLTKGQAGNIITRLKHGAKKRHDDKLKDAKKVTDMALKESLRRARETVQVGPLQQ
ncbi:P-loop containing nucleoside triphosphate hydrolase protein [Athelia psychrophila]|uniref:P-loop containing nucleoside triphosphate hydrolase protein n=1 Tax=Athelia psychrophila TaxID=1759441 RepID=A0A165ZGH0_9AGAM|nr:P-loop containing nucleoside triphosphate hydrolase protein [Fibularhizoctonia sp. CBS 109695]